MFTFSHPPLPQIQSCDSSAPKPLHIPARAINEGVCPLINSLHNTVIKPDVNFAIAFKFSKDETTWSKTN
ncbi:MAG: hypothetical protein V4649_12010 [Bacteroidota bacterium]